MIHDLKINAFRGLRGLSLPNLQDINLLLGDNDAGKTTVLEAVNFLSGPYDVDSMVRNSRLRFSYTHYYRYAAYSPFESFLHLFPFSAPLGIELSALINGDDQELSIRGELVKMLKVYTDEEFQQLGRSYSRAPRRGESIREHELEVTIFEGLLSHNGASIPFEIDENFSYRVPVEFPMRQLYSTLYVSPSSHLDGVRFPRLSKRESREVIGLLNLIDPEIEGFKLQQNEITGGFVQEIEHRRYGNIPLYTYGDGMKKILYFASRLASIKNGVLLLDEIETSLQSSLLTEVFSWLIQACRLSHIQLFVTTHSLEAISTLAKCAVSNDGELACYRLEKADCLSYAKRFSERELNGLVNGRGIDVR